MERNLQTQLIAWKNKPNRLPLILRGARQVGKTYLMKWLGQTHFQDVAYFNFDERPELRQFFQMHKDVDRITQSLALVSGKKLNANTLVIFDEIQECPEALNTLKYFAENKADLPIICAGSLLGVLLHSGHSFPVGKVEFLTVYPMTFREVLPYWDRQAAFFLDSLDCIGPIPEYFFHNLTDQFKKYLVTGGLPAVVREFNQSQLFSDSESTLQNLILSYKGDFAKHPVMSDVAKIIQVFESLPSQLARENKKFVFQLVKSGARAREYEDAIQWLVRSGLVHMIMSCKKPSIPLSAYDELSAFKLYAFDVGIMRRMAGLAPSAYAEGNRLFMEFKGAIIENYILQSLIPQFELIPRYWTSSNTAEVDFLIQFDNEIVPIEVKSDENVKSRSLVVYNATYHPKYRVRFSLKNLSFRDGLLNIPHFLSDHMAKLLQWCE